jgi:hypothetical protein
MSKQADANDFSPYPKTTPPESGNYHVRLDDGSQSVATFNGTRWERLTEDFGPHAYNGTQTITHWRQLPTKR